ncbi:MFS transporter [Gloeomargarita lithophora]|uniref:MFS transporter n=1 Tax=Gloeomargarita lithophora TaxID=1188228 RepID=UPI000AB06C45|nr:MFS transporter [Gloeomargarita lithophora]
MFHPQIWVLFVGRLLSQLGSGFTLFYAPIVFVNQVGLSATQVGIGLGATALSGIAGRIAGGWGSDRFGRKPVLVLAAGISALGCAGLAGSGDFTSFALGNLILGLGVGLYWPANEAAVADLTTPAQRQGAYALTRSADAVGLGLGVALGGILVGEWFRWLFIIDGITFAIFGAVVAVGLREPARKTVSHLSNMGQILVHDKTLQFYVVINVIFTFFLAQTNSALPLYLKNFVGEQGLSNLRITAFFTLFVLLTAVMQIPVIRLTRPLGLIGTLQLSAIFWGLGFMGIAGTGLFNLPAWVGLSVLALATVAYLPTASTWVAQLAPPELRGTYLAINSLCWSLGYLLGPPVGGWFLDLPRPWADGLWWVLVVLATALGVGLQRLGATVK